MFGRTPLLTTPCHPQLAQFDDGSPTTPEEPEGGADADPFGHAIEADADKFMAVKPWVGAIKAPEDFDTARCEQLATAPESDLEMEVQVCL